MGVVVVVVAQQPARKVDKEASRCKRGRPALAVTRPSPHDWRDRPAAAGGACPGMLSSRSKHPIPSCPSTYAGA